MDLFNTYEKGRWIIPNGIKLRLIMREVGIFFRY
jgi:hypothetical protein